MREIAHEFGDEDERRDVEALFEAGTELLAASGVERRKMQVHGFKNLVPQADLSIVSPSDSMLHDLGYSAVVIEHNPYVLEKSEGPNGELIELQQTLTACVWSLLGGEESDRSEPDEFYITKHLDGSWSLSKVVDSNWVDDPMTEIAEGPVEPYERVELRTIFDACRILVTINPK